jgi:hypothetical protein
VLAVGGSHSGGCGDEQALVCKTVLAWVRVPEMMSLRSPDLQLFLTLAETAIRHGSDVKGPACAAAERMFAALQAPSTQVGQPSTARLPVCRHLETALEHVRLARPDA